MTERIRSRIQAAEMSFLRRVAGHSLRDRVRRSVTREELGVEPLLLHIKRSQLRWHIKVSAFLCLLSKLSVAETCVHVFYWVGIPM